MDIKSLKLAIKEIHGCDSKHLGFTRVTNVFRGRKVWDGRVDIFSLKDHPKAQRCYAWSHRKGNEMRYVAVLEIPPVESAETAVRAALATPSKKHRTPN